MTIYLTPPAGGGGVANVASGTTTVEGTVRLATTVEAQDVNNETLAVTPKGLNAQIASAIAGGVTYEGTIAGDNIPTLTTATQGQLYKIDTASSGVVAGFNWSINDNLLINADMGGTFDASKINKIDSTDSDLATVASSGSYNDLSDKPSIPSASTDLTDTATLVRDTDLASTTSAGIIEIADATETSAGTSNALAVSPLGLATELGNLESTDLSDTASLVRVTDLATVATTGSYNDLLNQPTIPIDSTDLGDSGDLIRSADLATVATTGSYADLLNTPTIPSSSDDLTSDHDPTNYTGALNGSLTTHLAGIDTALGNALSGTTDSILEGQAKVETIDTGSDARIEFSADPNGTGTEKIWEFNSSGHLIPNVNDTYDIGSAEKKVRDLYLGSSTLYMGGTLSLGIVDGNLRLSGGGNLEVGTASVITDATLPSIPVSSADLSDGADLLKTGDIGVAIGDIVEVVDVGGSVAGISALDGSNLTNLTYANITGTPNLATVATTGASTDLTDTATLVRDTDLASTTGAGIVRLSTIAEAGGTSETLAVTPAGLQAELAGVVSGTQYQGAVAYDAISTDLVNASVGDMYRLSSSGSAHGYDWTIGDLIIVNADMGGTFDANKINRFDTTDADLATVATTGSYNDLTNTPTDSDDFTANLNPTNYLGVNNTDTITAHLGAIDTALANVGGGLSYTVITTPSYNALANTHAHYTGGSSNTLNVTLPAISTLSSGDVFVFSRAYNGSTVINKNSADSNCIIGIKSASAVASVTIDSQPTIFYFIFDGTNFRQAQSVLGSGAELNADNTANNLVKLDFQGRLPAIDGSLLSNLPYVPTEIRTSSGTSLTLSASLTNLVYWLIPTTGVATTITLPLTSTLSDGDSWTIQRQTVGDLVIQQNGSDTGAKIRFGASDASSHTINAPGQSFLITYDATSNKFYIFDQVFLQEISNDTTPQLGGDLDTNSNEIVTASNANLVLRPNGTGHVFLGGNTNPAELRLYCENADEHYVGFKSPAHSELSGSQVWRLPVADATTSGDALVSDGAGNLSFTTISGGGGTMTYSAVSANTTAQANYHYSCTGTITITLPAVSGTSAGDEIRIKNMGTGTITVDGNSTEVIDGSETYSMTIQYEAVSIVSNGSTGWEIF